MLNFLCQVERSRDLNKIQFLMPSRLRSREHRFILTAFNKVIGKF